LRGDRRGVVTRESQLLPSRSGAGARYSACRRHRLLRQVYFLPLRRSSFCAHFLLPSLTRQHDDVAAAFSAASRATPETPDYLVIFSLRAFA